jgi:hypothetical protein
MWVFRRDVSATPSGIKREWYMYVFGVVGLAIADAGRARGDAPGRGGAPAGAHATGAPGTTAPEKDAPEIDPGTLIPSNNNTTR